VLGARSSGKYTPELWHEVFASPGGPGRGAGRPPRARVGPRRLALGAGLVAAGFAAGAVCAALVLRRRRAASAPDAAQRG
jgi:hypothetical protein